MKVTVFGGSQPSPGDPAYEEALQLGRMLGETGFTVLTGGYIGTMEAISCGAAEMGGHVIGVTCDEIESWRAVGPNAWVMEEMRFPAMRQRLFALIENCDAALALPGGVGTLAEIAVMWSHLQTGAIPPRPLILIGSRWKATLESFYDNLGQYTTEHDRQWIKFTPDVTLAMEMLKKYDVNNKTSTS
jgi:uncharacterized protein (TIGR00730 family)